MTRRTQRERAEKEHGILMSAPMALACHEGRKTQTRRAVKHQHASEIDRWAAVNDGAHWDGGVYGDHGALATMLTMRAPHGPVGRRLWVRETWRRDEMHPDVILYRASTAPALLRDSHGAPVRWVSPLIMPRACSRTTLEVTRIRVERVRDISDNDLRAECVTAEAVRMLTRVDVSDGVAPRMLWQVGWSAINGAESWEENPWCWVYDFAKVDGADVRGERL